MTQSRTTGFEDGTLSSAYTLDTLANGSGSTCDNTYVAHGSKSVKETGSGSYQYVQGNFGTASTTARARYALAQDTALTGNFVDMELHSDTTSIGSTNVAVRIFRSSSNKFLINDATGSTIKTFTTSIPTDGSFLVLELQIVCGTSANATINARLYTSAAPGTILETFSTTTATTTATIQSMHLGKVTSGAFSPSTGKTWHDDFAFDDGSSGWIGPFADTPIANAGSAQVNIEPYATVTLNGSGSNDPGALGLTYAWTQTGGTTVTLSSTTAQNPTYTAPATVNGDTQTFSLVVTNTIPTASTASTTTVQVAAHTLWNITNPTGPVLTPIRVSIL